MVGGAREVRRSGVIGGAREGRDRTDEKHGEGIKGRRKGKMKLSKGREIEGHYVEGKEMGEGKGELCG